MNVIIRSVLILWVGSCGLSPLLARTPSRSREKTDSGKPSQSVTDATRLQIFLDRANFSPGRLDGRYGEFTLKALSLYRQSRGEPTPAPTKTTKAPNLDGLDLSSVDPVFVDYQVTDTDLSMIGPAPEPIADRAKLKALLYRNATEALAEKFHCDTKFLAHLNPGKLKSVKAGDHLLVPNVEPFDVTAVKSLKVGSEIKAIQAANEIDGNKEDDAEGQAKGAPDSKGKPEMNLRVDVTKNELGVFEGDKLVASYPVSLGASETASPLGDWKVIGIAKMPTFRYDEDMLKHGERSDKFVMLPPGPNNPVGVVWIALNKKGIGIHGGKDPDKIGRSESHGCIRLANWDVVRLAERVKGGVPVTVKAY